MKQITTFFTRIFLFPGLSVLCILITAIDSSGDGSMFDKKKENINIPVHLEMIGTDLEKEGPYLITLAFQRGKKSLAEFEDILQHDFTGEIEIRLRGKHYKTIYYEDFVSFAPAPVGEGYGPVYSLDVDFLGNYSGYFDFYPKIRTKKPCSYSFSITRKKLSFKEKLGRFFRKKKQKETPEPPVTHKPELQVRAEITRINIAFEKEWNYGFSLGFPEKLIEKDDINTYTDFDGEVEIRLDDKYFSTIKYSDARWASDLGGKDGFKGRGYRAGYFTKGFCSVIPRIKSVKECAFAINIGRSYSRK